MVVNTANGDYEQEALEHMSTNQSTHKAIKLIEHVGRTAETDTTGIVNSLESLLT